MALSTPIEFQALNNPDGAKSLDEMGRFVTVVVDPPWPIQKTGARKSRSDMATWAIGPCPFRQ